MIMRISKEGGPKCLKPMNLASTVPGLRLDFEILLGLLRLVRCMQLRLQDFRTLGLRALELFMAPSFRIKAELLVRQGLGKWGFSIADGSQLRPKPSKPKKPQMQALSLHALLIIRGREPQYL